MSNAPTVTPKTCATCKRVFATESDYLTGTSRWRVCEQKNLWFNCSCGSTLIIANGKYDWYSPDKTMSPAAAGIFNKIATLKDLPHLPTSVMEIQQGLQSPDLDVPTLAKKVKQDPFLAANLLTIANNIKTSRDPRDLKKIEGIEHAIMYIGKKAFGELVMTISLQGFKTSTKVFNTELFWKEAFIVGELAEIIAQKWGGQIIKDEVFISATLCNIGKIVGALAMPQNVDKIEAMVENPKTLCTWPQAESILKVPSHSLLGEIGGAMWGLPKYVLESASDHHQTKAGPTDPPARPGSKLTLKQCVALANQLSHWIMLRPSRIDLPVINYICKPVGITSKDLDDFASEHSKLAVRAA